MDDILTIEEAPQKQGNDVVITIEEAPQKQRNDVVMTIKEAPQKRGNDIVITIEEDTETATISNNSAQTEDLPAVVPECQQILKIATPQRSWGLVYANYHHSRSSLEAPVQEKITWKFAAIVVAWILLVIFAVTVGCEWYLETTVAHTAEGTLAIIGIVGIFAIISAVK